MKRLAYTVVAAIGLTMSVQVSYAADLQAPAIKAPAVGVPASAWTGCYIGGNVGGAWGRSSSILVGLVGGTPVTPANFGSERQTGFIGGGQVGCDYQTGPWVFGVAGQFDFGKIKGSHVFPTFPTYFANSNIRSIVTATGRIGYAIQPAALFYVKGGGAWKREDIDVFYTIPKLHLFESTRITRAGWTVGAGLEWMFASGWSAFAEYNYMGFGRKNVIFTPAPLTEGEGDIMAIHQNAQTVLVGINWRFGSPGPVIAKY